MVYRQVLDKYKGTGDEYLAQIVRVCDKLYNQTHDDTGLEQIVPAG